MITSKTALRWVCRRYVGHLVMGAFGACLFVNMVLYSAIGLQYYCEQECFAQTLSTTIYSFDKYLIKYIREKHLDPPFEVGSYRGNFSLKSPPWANMGHWDKIHSIVNEYFKNSEFSIYTTDHYRLTPLAENQCTVKSCVVSVCPSTYNAITRPENQSLLFNLNYLDNSGASMNASDGIFVEVGGQDGEFMSQTLWLEQVKNFSGLLIEPNPNEYKKLREKKRSAFSTNTCTLTDFVTYKNQLWIRNVPDGVPTLLQRFQRGSNKLIEFVKEDDRDSGIIVDVNCFNLGSLVLAALNTKLVDFLSISTHGGELEILESIQNLLQIKMLMMVIPNTSNSYAEDLKRVTEAMNLRKMFRFGSSIIYFSNKYTEFADK